MVGIDARASSGANMVPTEQERSPIRWQEIGKLFALAPTLPIPMQPQRLAELV